MEQTKQPLSGIKVVELANYVAVPVVGRICASLGAEVVKIETNGGDAWRFSSAGYTRTDFSENPLFDIYNLGKKCISLNIKTPEGKRIIKELLADADIFLTNIREQSLKKLGLRYEDLKDEFPCLIYAAMTGYGYKGPDCNAPGFDNIAFWSRSGFSADMSFQAEGSYPVNSRFAMGDTVSGTTLFGGVMTALYRRERTGLGDFVTMSLLHAGVWMVGGCLVMAQEPYQHDFPDKRLAGIAMNLPYKCSDGEWIRCTIFEYDRYAPKFFDALGIRDEMIRMGVRDNQSMTDMAEKIVPIYERIFLKKSSQEWLSIFESLDIVCGRLYHFKDVLTDEQIWANHYLQHYTCTNGETRIITAPPVRLASQGTRETGQPAMYGSGNSEVLAGLGYALEEIQRLTEKGVFS